MLLALHPLSAEFIATVAAEPQMGGQLIKEWVWLPENLRKIKALLKKFFDLF